MITDVVQRWTLGRAYRHRQLLDAELDDVVRERAGRSPTRLERKAGATGTFAIARSKPREVR